MKLIILALLLAGIARANEIDDKLARLTGEWSLQRPDEQSPETLLIKGDHSLTHSTFGAGDFVYIAGDRYEIKFYQNFAAECQVTIHFTADHVGVIKQLAGNPKYCLEGQLRRTSNVSTRKAGGRVPASRGK